MTGLACLFGVHSSLESVSFTSIDAGGFVIVTRVRCARCLAPISEEVRPVAELPERDN